MEYSDFFEGNIRADDFNENTMRIVDWIKENRDKFDWAKDPNAYEMSNVFLFAGKYKSENKDVDLESVKAMWEIRKGDFENCNISEKNFVYKICEDAFNSAIEGKALVNDESSHHALRKMAAIGLWLNQQKRDRGLIEYNNPTELLGLIQASKSLRVFHPDLFKKYQFSENISRLCNLQLEHGISDKTANTISDAYQDMMGEKEEDKVIYENGTEYEK